MNRMFLASAGLAISTLLSGCEGQLQTGNGIPLIAVPRDRGLFDGKENTLVDGQAGIAYDPDGCQVWVIDDGVEGYSGRRVDPASGLIVEPRHPDRGLGLPAFVWCSVIDASPLSRLPQA